MTRKEIRNSVAERVEDVNFTRFTRSFLNERIQWNYALLVLLSGSRLTSGDVDFADDLVYYTMSDYLTEYYRPFAIYNLNTARWLTPIGFKQLENLDYNWETANSEARYFCPVGVNKIAFYPHLLTASGSFKIYYYKSANTLTDSVSPSFGSDYHSVLVDLTAADALFDTFEFKKAQDILNVTRTSIQDLVESIERIGATDRLYQHVMHYGNP